MVQLKAILGGIRIDRDGETKIVLEIPLNQMSEAAKLCGAIHQVLNVTFQTIESGVIGGTPVRDDADAPA